MNRFTVLFSVLALLALSVSGDVFAQAPSLPAALTINDGTTVRTWEGMMRSIHQNGSGSSLGNWFGFTTETAPQSRPSDGVFIADFEKTWEGDVQDNSAGTVIYFAGCTMQEFAFMDEGGMHLWLRCPPSTLTGSGQTSSGGALSAASVHARS